MSYVHEESEPESSKMQADQEETATVSKPEYSRLDFGAVTTALFQNLQSHIHDAASAICENLANQILDEGNQPISFEGLRHATASTADIEQNVEQLQRQLHFTRSYYDGYLPCIPAGEFIVPIAIPNFETGKYAPIPNPADIYYIFKNRPSDIYPEVHYLKPEEAVFGFSQQLTAFLTGRMAASTYFSFGKRPSDSPGGSNMLTVRVHTQTIGARVSYSPAYFINFIVFSGPTTPAESYILPGRYIFLLATADRDEIRDSGVFDIPPSFDLTLMV